MDQTHADSASTRLSGITDARPKSATYSARQYVPVRSRHLAEKVASRGSSHLEDWHHLVLLLNDRLESTKKHYRARLSQQGSHHHFPGTTARELGKRQYDLLFDGSKSKCITGLDGGTGSIPFRKSGAWAGAFMCSQAVATTEFRKGYVSP